MHSFVKTVAFYMVTFCSLLLPTVTEVLTTVHVKYKVHMVVCMHIMVLHFLHLHF